MRPNLKLLTVLVAALLALGSGAGQAQGRPGGHGGHAGGHGGGHGGWGYGPYWGGLGFGIGFGLGAYGRGYYGNSYGNYYGYPGYVVIESPPAIVYQQAPAAAMLPVPPSMAEPVIYPRNGQDPAQTEADRQACNRWATTQPSAMADASVFQRATLACMDGRGYTLK